MTLREDVQSHVSSESQTAFSPSLASLYETREGPGRKRHLAMALGLTGSAVLLAAMLDHINAPAQFNHSLPWRSAVVILCVSGALVVLRVRPGLWQGLAFGIPLVALVVLSAWIGAAAPPHLADRNIVMSLILYAVLCAVPPVPVLLTRILAVLWFWCFAVTLWLTEGMQLMSHNLMALAVGAVALAIGVGLASRREAARRREFLHRLHAELTAAELTRINAELERLINTDVLTGVANRRRFETDMQAAWQARLTADDRSGPIGLILADVDHFKSFNDGAGHAQGDACLRAIANAISAVMRGEAFGVARWGGEEFAALAPGIASWDIEGLAERVRAAVEDLAIPHPAWPGRVVTVSVGTAWCGPDVVCESPDALLCTADRALYAAKSAGRNCVMVSMHMAEMSRSDVG